MLFYLFYILHGRFLSVAFDEMSDIERLIQAGLQEYNYENEVYFKAESQKQEQNPDLDDIEDPFKLFVLYLKHMYAI